MRGEISFDLVMDDEMSFVEGTFKLPGDDWQVFIFTRKAATQEQPIWSYERWESGARGVVVAFPSDQLLNATSVELLLSKILGVSEWVRVHGPDSMQLR